MRARFPQRKGECRSITVKVERKSLMTPRHEDGGRGERQGGHRSQQPSEENQLREILQKERTRDFSQELTSLKKNIHGSIHRSHIRQLSHVHKEGSSITYKEMV